MSIFTTTDIRQVQKKLFEDCYRDEGEAHDDFYDRIESYRALAERRMHWHYTGNPDDDDGLENAKAYRLYAEIDKPINDDDNFQELNSLRDMMSVTVPENPLGVDYGYGAEAFLYTPMREYVAPLYREPIGMTVDSFARNTRFDHLRLREIPMEGVHRMAWVFNEH